MNDFALDAAGPAGAAPETPNVAANRAATAVPLRRSRWPARLLILAALGAVLMLGLWWLAQGLGSLSAPVHVMVDGQPVFSGWSGNDMPPAHRVVLAAVLMMGLLAALLIVPLALLLGLLAVLAVVLTVVGLPLIVLLAALALLVSPLLLLGWVVWKIAT